MIELSYLHTCLSITRTLRRAFAFRAVKTSNRL